MILRKHKKQIKMQKFEVLIKDYFNWFTYKMEAKTAKDASKIVLHYHQVQFEQTINWEARIIRTRILP